MNDDDDDISVLTSKTEFDVFKDLFPEITLTEEITDKLRGPDANTESAFWAIVADFENVNSPRAVSRVKRLFE